MGISNRDTKILWSKAAGRCSYPGCPQELVLEPESDGKHAVIGEMAHIVAEESDGPRGNSPLSKEQRNSYANLILLCPNHHELIDDPDQVESYPVELLHEWKSKHEDEVKQKYVSSEVGEWQDEYYAYLTDQLTEILDLEKWNAMSESLVRDFVPTTFADAQANLSVLFLGAVWPGTRPRIEEAMKRVIDSYNTYMEHFGERATADVSGKFLRADHSYYQASGGDPYRVHIEGEKENAWSRKNFDLLCEFVVSLNEFADVVRAELNPRYLLERGRFLLIDSLGVRGTGTSGQIILPGHKLSNRSAKKNSPKRIRASKRPSGKGNNNDSTE